MSQINLFSLSLSFFSQPRMDQYFNQMEKIVKERKTSSRIRFMLQDIIDLRLVSVWLWWLFYLFVALVLGGIYPQGFISLNILTSWKVIVDILVTFWWIDVLLLFLLNLNTFSERLMGEKPVRKYSFNSFSFILSSARCLIHITSDASFLFMLQYSSVLSSLN